MLGMTMALMLDIDPVAALAFDDWRASGVASKVCGGPTGTGRGNAYFLASLNGGPPGGS